MSKKKRLLIYSDCMFYGGCENVITNLLTNSDLQSDFEITFAFRYSAAYLNGFKQAVKDGHGFKLEKISLPVFDTWIYYSKVQQKKRYFIASILLLEKLMRFSGVAVLISAVKLAFLISRVNPDVIHLNNGGYPAAMSVRLASVVARALGYRSIIMTINNLAYPQGSALAKSFDHLVAKSTSFFVTASRAAAKELIAQRRFDSKKTLTIPNATPPPKLTASLRQELCISQDKFIFAAAGLLTQRKGFDVLLHAAAMLAKRHHQDFVVLIFGDGEEKQNLERLHESLKLANTVKFMGHCADFTQRLSDVDVLVTPSRSNEDMPYVLIEAAAAAKPCIGTKVAGIPEVIADGHSGIVIEPDNVAQLATAMAKMLEDRSFLNNCSKEARQVYLSNHTVETCVASYMRLYELAKSDRAPRVPG